MLSVFRSLKHRCQLGCLLGALVGLLGCGGEVRFAPDELLRANSGLSPEQSAAIDAALLEWFGTPDEPKLPEGLAEAGQLLDLELLKQAAGPVESHTPGVTHGLYRRHCARCHGVTGDGRGPTALYQDPYPRDFRLGVFKWKSTRRDAPPTDADLHALLERGAPGTAMPSFALLTIEERESLKQYLQYLALRGAAERELIRFTAEELPAEQAFDHANEAMQAVLIDHLAQTVQDWLNASDAVVWPDESIGSDGLVALGRDLYHSQQAGCAKCHGQAGQGGAKPGVDYEIDFDAWSRPRVDAANPQDDFGHALAKQLPPRDARPRAIVGEALRGGGSPLDLFRRLHQGVAGTPMPALGARRTGEEATLSDREIMAIAQYVATLTPAAETPSYDNQTRAAR